MPNININDYSVITEEQFNAMQFDSGVITKNFDPAAPDFSSTTVLCATTGNITVSSVPTIVDLGEDVNNINGSLIELQYLDRWEHTLSFTALDMTAATIKLGLGATKDSETISGGIEVKNYLSKEDFSTDPVWWVGMLVGGGMAYARFSYFLNTAGLSLSTSKSGKGTMQYTLRCYGTIENAALSPVVYGVVAGTTPPSP